VEVGVVLVWQKRQLTGDQGGSGDDSDWAEDDVMTMTGGLRWSLQKKHQVFVDKSWSDP
jgi:hypothetical protein